MTYFYLDKCCMFRDSGFSSMLRMCGMDPFWGPRSCIHSHRYRNHLLHRVLTLLHLNECLRKLLSNRKSEFLHNLFKEFHNIINTISKYFIQTHKTKTVHQTSIFQKADDRQSVISQSLFRIYKLFFLFLILKGL